MRYFNITFFLLGLFLTAVSCGQRDNFDSIGDSSGATELILPSEGDDHKDKIVKLVNEKKIIKIGGKDKKRLPANLSQTVGQNNLKNQNKRSKSADDKTVKADKGDETIQIELAVKAAQDSSKSTDSKKQMHKKNLSLLMYFEDKSRGCVPTIKKHSDDFIEGMNQVHSWKMLFAFHSDRGELLPISHSKYTLDKNSNTFTESVERKFYNMLDYEMNYHTEIGPRPFADSEPRLNNKSDDLLQGLDNILSSKMSSKDKKIVLYFDSDFPYIATEEWKTLYNKHKDLSILAISSRKGNFSNLNSGFNAGVDLIPIYDCQNILKHILKRAL